MNSTEHTIQDGSKGIGRLWNRITIAGMAVIIFFSAVYFLIAKDTLSKQAVSESYSNVETIATIGEMGDGTEV